MYTLRLAKDIIVLGSPLYQSTAEHRISESRSGHIAKCLLVYLNQFFVGKIAVTISKCVIHTDGR